MTIFKKITSDIFLEIPFLEIAESIPKRIFENIKKILPDNLPKELPKEFWKELHEMSQVLLNPADFQDEYLIMM